MADPNLDLGLDYTGGINKPTVEQIGYIAIVDETGTNLKYLSVADFITYLGGVPGPGPDPDPGSGTFDSTFDSTFG